MYRYRGGEKTRLPPRLVPYEVSISEFIRACDRLSDDQMFRLDADTALTKQHRELARP